MKDFLRVAAIIAVAIILGVNLANTFRPLLFIWGGPPDFVTISEERLRRVRTTAPKTGEIGYVGQGNPSDALVEPEAVKQYYLTQYALTPLVVIPALDKPLTVRYTDESVNAEVQAGDTVVHFGPGVVVVEQQSK